MCKTVLRQTKRPDWHQHVVISWSCQVQETWNFLWFLLLGLNSIQSWSSWRCEVFRISVKEDLWYLPCQQARTRERVKSIVDWYWLDVQGALWGLLWSKFLCFKTKAIKNPSIQGLHGLEPADGKAHQQASAQRGPDHRVENMVTAPVEVRRF